MHTTSRSPLIRRLATATTLLGVLGASSVALAGPAAAAPAPTTCKSVTKNISDPNIAKHGPKLTRGAFGCQSANAVSNTWMLRFNDRMQVQRFSVDSIGYRCSRSAPMLPRNTQCIGGGTLIRFAAPTGGDTRA